MNKMLKPLLLLMLTVMLLTACAPSAPATNEPAAIPTMSGLPEGQPTAPAVQEGEGYPAPENLIPTPNPDTYPAPDLLPTMAPEEYPSPVAP